MATTSSLTNTNISETYVGILHAMGTALPPNGQQHIHDGDGNRTALKIGREGQGVTINGGITTNNSFILNALTVPVSSASYPRIQFGTPDDNTDDIYITRVNSRQDRSELRINIADNIGTPNDKFTIGGTAYPLTTFTPLLTLSGDGNMTVQLAAHTTAYKRPADWGGGVTSFDFYSDGGAFGAGVGGSLAAFFTKNGDFVGKTYSSTSSIQFKTNVTPLENALEIIGKLEGVRFDWRDTGKSDIGLIAEDVNKVLPEFVFKNEETGEPQGVDYGKITSVLIEAVKELTKLVIK
jgi:hypothetical protein